MRELDAAPAEVEVHAAAFLVTLLRAGMLEEAESFWDWYFENIGESQRLEGLLETEGLE